ncbi:long-chain acyl-CoA synthetase [Psychrobacter sp. PL15]|uniref:AMP-binding protein n=1 Tax=Psychrobacter sp. PL15 TaxID=3071719 RepID=UPI002DFFA00E|nr:long-chain acyl-CoA synthetase [Psychrobacter sp. PL15]
MEKFWTEKYPAGVLKEVASDQYPSLTHLFDDMFANYANREFSTNMEVSYTYAQIDVISKNISAWLQSQGLKKGDKVALMMPNVNQYMPIVLGILRAGYVVTSINPMYTARELKHQLDDTQASILFILEPFCQVLEKIVSDSQVKTVIVSKIGDMLGTAKGTLVNLMAKHVKKAVPAHGLKSNSQYQLIDLKAVMSKGKSLPYVRPEQNIDDLAFVQYTGGTTGVAKGVLLSHRNLISGTMQFDAWLAPTYKNIKEGTVVNSIIALPLYHFFAFMVVMIGIRAGHHFTLITNPRDIDGFIKTLATRPFHILPAVNTLFQALIQHPDIENLDFSNLIISLSGGMAATPATSQKWIDMTGTALVQGWGMTETVAVGTLNPIVAKADFNGKIGMPLPGVDMTIRDDDENELPIGEIGEICLKGDNVTQGYNNMDSSAYFTHDGYLKTGDIGAIGEDGYVTLYDRKKDMLIVSGFNVFPNEVEGVVGMHPKVSECGVVGVDDLKRGQAIKVFVVKSDKSLTEDEIIEHCKENLTGYKRPRYIEFCDELPKSSVGKILRNELRKKASISG